MRKQNRQFTHSLYSRLIAMVIAVMMLSVAPPALLAQEAEPAATDGRNNDGSREFGVWWVEDYDPAGSGGSDLPATRPDALGLRDQLTSTCKTSFLGICWSNWATPTWTARFVWGNSNAWSTDWRRSANGGSENSYIDSIDLAYFAGHGSTSGILFGANSPTPRTVTKDDALSAWGDQDLDWAALAACNVLDDPVSNLQGWANGMNGVRLILGFKTVMNDVPHGVEFGRYIRDGYSLTQAWFKAADKLQSQNRVARVLAEDTAYFDDTYAHHNAFTSVNGTKYYRTHTVGSEPARFVDVAQINQQMPVLEVQPLSLSAAQQRIGSLENAFGVTLTVPTTGTVSAGIQAALEDGGVFYANNGELEMDANYGLFLHVDKSLWSTESEALRAASGSAMQSISEEGAKQIADGFLNQYGLMPGDAQFYEVAADTMTTMAPTVDASGVTSLDVVDVTTTNYQVIYSRIISVPLSLNGRATSDTVEYSVMGPGSKLKVYVATQAPSGVSGASLYSEAVQGGMGGYRAIQDPVSAAAAGKLQMVDMLPFAKIEKLFNILEPTVALDYVPLAPEQIQDRQIITHTPAYWEGPIGFNQNELIPIYALTVRNLLTDNVVVTSTTSIPVAAPYMAPLARISSTVDLTKTVTPGEIIILEAFDASQTLVQLGLDPSPNDGNPLDFNLGTQGGAFTYDWYVNQISPATKLTPKEGTGGRIVEYAVDLTKGVDGKDASGTQRIILVVTDVEKNGEPNSSQAVLTLTATPPVYLPAVQN